MTPLDRLRPHLTRSDGIRLASSLLLAIILWGWVTTAQDPEIRRSFTEAPIVAPALPDDLVIVGTLPTATLRLSGPRSVVNAIASSSVQATLDLDGVTEPGSYTVDVDADVDDDVWSVEVSPARLAIVVEHTVAKQFPLVAALNTQLTTAGQSARVSPEVSEVTVRGPTSLIDRIAEVQLPIDLAGQTRDFTGVFTPQAMDGEGQIIPEVAVSPDAVAARVELSQRGKRLAVITSTIGTPAEGYEVIDRTIIPTTVLVDGPPASLESLITVATQPIDISGLMETVSRRVSLTGLPDDVIVIDPSGATVDVVIQIRQEGLRQPLPPQTIEPINLGPGLTADLTPGSLDLVVLASEQDIASLEAGQLSVQVDLSGLQPGVHLLEPRVSLPPNVQWISADPAMISVTIRAAATPEATPQPPA